MNMLNCRFNSVGPMSKVRGVTLIELLVTVAILAILLAIGVPGFQDFFASNRAITSTSDFMTSLSIARSEAIKRGQRVVVCKSANPLAALPACTSADTWAQGWIVFVDDNNDATRQNSVDEPILRVHAALEQTSFSGNANVADYVSFTGTGATKMTSGAIQSGTLTLCASPVQREVIISSGGRIRVRDPGAAC